MLGELSDAEHDDGMAVVDKESVDAVLVTPRSTQEAAAGKSESLVLQLSRRKERRGSTDMVRLTSTPKRIMDFSCHTRHPWLEYGG